ESPNIPIMKAPKAAKIKLININVPLRYLSANLPKRGEGRPAAKVPIVPNDPNPIQRKSPKFGKRFSPTRSNITGKIKKGISTLQWIKTADIRLIFGVMVFVAKLYDIP
ncbi:MAG: hypothetical protein ACFFDT_28455, partial [Candidatus Hodarchaeota archaeon]